MWLVVKFCWFVVLVCFATNRNVLGQTFNGEKIAIGAIFDQNTEEIQNVFKYAMTQHKQNVSSRGRFELQAYVDVINTADAFKLSRLICNQFARGVWSMLGAVTPDSFDTLHSYTNTFQMPFVTPWFPEKVIPPSSGLIDHAVNMRPEYHKAIVDTILYYGWNEIIYVYDSYDGLLRLQQLYQLIQPGRTYFKISFVKLINNSTEAIEFLLDLERLNRWGAKRIVLDCSATTAKSIIVSHVQHTQLGRRTYHYLLSGLVMDDHWEKDVMEYGALNITGFRIIDHSRKQVRDFIEGFRKMDSRVKDSISAQAALMYDGVQALIDALTRLWRKKPDAFKNAIRRTINQGNVTKVIDCNPGKNWVVPFEHGDKISRLIKKSELEGLTGNISFNDDGHRHDFILHIVEMTVQSVMVKVATWSDKHGLISLKSKHALNQSSQNIHFNKTYVITTILQEPYMMLNSLDYGELSNEQFYGFCKDLIEYISQETGINFVIKVVKDGAYGSEGSNKEWNGMVGELKRKEADLAVGPLAITKERENIVDFSEPFLSFNYAIKTRRNAKSTDTFSFLKPLSKEIWLCVIFSFFAVSIVLFLLSRFSPREWNFLSYGGPVTDRNDVILHNEYSIWNSFWFSVGSFMQQGIDNVPKSFSGRIVGTVWWFFALILVCSYTANFAAYLIVECLNEPAKALHSLASSDSLACTNIGEDPVLAGDDLKSTDYAIDENGINICSKGFHCKPKFVEFAIAFPKESQIREKINLVILNMKKSEKLSKILRKWLLKKDQQDCMLEKKEENLVTELTLSQVAGIFYILIGGLIVALSVALLEFYHSSYSGTTKATALKTTTTKIKLDNKRDGKNINRVPVRDSHRHTRWNGAPYQGFFNATNHLAHEDNLQANFTHV